jgi:hypothetical protein
MPLDATAENHVVEFAMTVEAGKIHEFARACMSSSPAYSPAPSPVMPPTFLTTSCLWLGEESLPVMKMGLDLTRTLHAEEEYEFMGPPPKAGTRLLGKSWIADRFSKLGRRGGTLTFVVTKTEYRDDSERLVAIVTTTAVQTTRPPKEEPTG